MKRLLKYYQPYKFKLLWALLGSTCVALLEVFFPMCLRYIMQVLLPTKDITLLLKAAGALFVMYILTCLLNYKVSVVGRTISALIEKDMRQELFAHVQKLSFSYFDNQRVGQLISRIVSDVAEVRELLFLGPNYLLVCLVMMLGTMFALFWLNWQLALLVNFLLLAKAYDSASTNRKLKLAGRATRSMLGTINADATESLQAIRLVQSFTNEKAELAKMSNLGDELIATRKRSFELLGHTNASMVFFSNVTNLVIIVVGSILIAYDKMQVSDLITFLLYVAVFIRPVLRLNALADMYQKGIASYQRFEEMLTVEPEIQDVDGAQPAENLQGEIAFQNVSFAYRAGEPILENFSLKIKAGEKVAFVGETGVGKSTLCNLLPRFYEVQQGSITIDGKNIRKLTLESLRRNIGIVSQDIFLFSASVRENIAYGNLQASEKEILATARLAEVDEFAEHLPEGYATELGERGVKISGGLKQRIAFARAFLINPPILILDEATSSLDNATEKSIQHALERLAHNRTTLIVAHRLASVQNADRIVVLGKKGVILEQGTHAELLAKNGAYAKLYNTQFEK